MRDIAHRLVEHMLDKEPFMPPLLPDETEPEPVDPRFKTHDLALDYVESEVGRHDWENNWKQHKTKHGTNIKDAVHAWLNRFEIDHDPQGIIDYIDKDLMSRPGKWL